MVHFFLAILSLCAAAAPCPLRFRITLPPDAAAAPVSGRMLVFMTDSATHRQRIDAGWFDRTWIAARELESIAPGETVDLDPDVIAWPRPFSQAAPGAYQLMALLDRDRDYNYRGLDPDDLYSPVIRIELPAAAPVAFSLSRREPPLEPRHSETTDLVEYESPLLSRFWGRPIRMRAAVVLPPSYNKDPQRSFPAIYYYHGFTGDYTDAYRWGPEIRRLMQQGKGMEAVQVYLDGACPTGDHEFADSANNGPWGRALTEEFIPYLEHNYRLIARSSARFLTGHSSGGWASLWDQITYPDFFGGAWSTAPDPVDFRGFITIDVAPGSHDNAYRTPGGRPHNLARRDGRDLITIEDFAKKEQVLGPCGGQFESFEWVFSPKGDDGRPLQLFNRVTGDLNPDTMRAWQKYDIRSILAGHWPELGPKLRGKLHLIVGAEDTFHLEVPTAMLCDFLKSHSSDATCEIVPGRDHLNLYDPYKTYPDGLAARILQEMTKASTEPRP